MKHEVITENSIKELVDGFYFKIRDDENLGPIFEQVIGESDQEWQAHLNIMYDFWSALMLRSGRFKGNPHKKHKELPFFDVHLFERWLELFQETAEDIHTPEIAMQYKMLSQNIAKSLKFSVEMGQKENA